MAALAIGSAAPATELQGLDRFVDNDGVRDLELMYADLKVMDADRLNGFGAVRHFIWTNYDGEVKELYRATITVDVPAKVPGFETLEAAMNADVRILLRTEGVPYAECLLPAQAVTSPAYVTYQVEMIVHEDFVKPIRGICDINLRTPGIQPGIPQMHYLDLITGLARHETVYEVELMEGFCY